MKLTAHALLAALATTALLAGGSAQALTAADYQSVLIAAAKAAEPGFAGFSAERGAAFYRSTHGGDWSCASCHTEQPTQPGSHAVTHKQVKPLAPAANPERFTRADKIEKWFKRNCNDVLKRACTPREQGDFIAYLLSVK
ncbi:MAG: DUF1924 domain-containing protein [Gammaproteobacteria bacterium]|nr:DUF1924 domain-containing protein [Gammaproteobacteria bacterium]MBU1646131.1 DUF1924 domain-containing protein [Gammaproteobacteria bacterium]MBU1972193.1 DUF1924 domain-containing protein [Gammaproteobacteria bacterium]